MKTLRWSNREMLLVALVAFFSGVVVTAVWRPRNEPNDLSAVGLKSEPAPAKKPTSAPKTEPTPAPKTEPKTEPPPKLTAAELEFQQLAKAHTGCKTLSRAIELYCKHPANPGTTDDERLPTSALELVKPAFGGMSLLPNGELDLIDPWGAPYQFERQSNRDDTVLILVRTTSSGGIEVSQFGVGLHSFPPPLLKPPKKD